MRRLTVILGVPLDEVTLAEAVARIAAFARRRDRPRQVATANTDFVARAQSDARFRDILRRADLVTADGMPLVWASRLLGGRLPERVAGADLVPALAGYCAREGLSLYLLGARPEVARAAATRLQEWHPRLRLAGVHSPPLAALEAMDHEDILRRLEATRPDVLLVAFGSPKQEEWIARHARVLPVPVAVGVGGSLDFLAGHTRRAPAWVQRAGAEWLWRLGNEPRRLWRRYAFDLAAFGGPLARHLLVARRLAGVRGGLGGEGSVWVDGKGALRVQGALDAGTRERFEVAAGQALAPGRAVAVVLAECTFLDSAGLGCLAALCHRARELGGDIRLIDVPPPIRRLLRPARLDTYLNCAPPAEARS
ncbi:MAG: WecB/TagA/CpsF family glycosyltransferase [Armatimonadetes bacterium]|jgi:N-acetylglucosaminyldiphosphoundecaprenol N-acetyl-beta-D-mannosaminyltransferase|nr:WecB/TagA/CpsF family glycosyltransferase [Armatimonadota bacterium]